MNIMLEGVKFCSLKHEYYARECEILLTQNMNIMPESVKFLNF